MAESCFALQRDFNDVQSVNKFLFCEILNLHSKELNFSFSAVSAPKIIVDGTKKNKN